MGRDRRYLAGACKLAMGVSVALAATGCGRRLAKDDAVREEIVALVGKLKSPDAEVRRAAAAELGKLSDRRAVKPLIDSLGDESPQVGLAAATGLRRIGDVRGFRPVYRLARKSTGKTRQALLGQVARWGAQDTERDRAVLQKLSKKIGGGKFKRIELRDAMNLVQAISGVCIWVDWAAMGVLDDRDLGGRHNFQLDNVRCDDALWGILLPLDKRHHGIVWTVTDGVVIVTGVSEMEKLLSGHFTVDGVVVKTPTDVALANKLSREMKEVHLRDIELLDVIEYFSDMGGVKIEVDWDALRMDGIDSTTTVDVRLPPLPWRIAFRLTLWDAVCMGKLDYMIKNGKIVVVGEKR